VSLPATFHVGRLLEDYASVVRDRGAALPEEYAELLELARNIELALPPAPSAPCHNDLLAANVIRALEDERLLIVDWEYAGMGDPRFDLGNLCVNNDFDEHAEEQLLRSYLARAPTDAERAALRLMRLLSDAREAAWGIVQSAISELEFDFERYAREHMGRLQETLANAPLSQWLTTAHG
jgi:thiamine kinase-like enzyme